MKKTVNKINNIHYVALTLFIILIASVASASYRKPTTDPTGANGYGYITLDATAGVKDGGLSVYTFTANKNATLYDQAIFTGPLLGADASSSTLKFGASSTPTNLEITQDLTVTNLQSDTLKTGTGTKQVCADAANNYLLCP